MIATTADFEECKKLNKKHGKSYYLATKFLTRKKRMATHALYAFFRVPDEFVDNPTEKTPDAIRASLEKWREAWRQAYHFGSSDHPVLRATVNTFHQYNIPYEYSEDFLKAMIQDIDVDRYETFTDLKEYMYGSAAVFGLMMCYVIGFTDERALIFAERLGYAMQLTNFLRDIEEDFRERGRVYLPQEDLRAFNVSDEDIRIKRFTSGFNALMSYEIARARDLYRDAEPGIPLLDRDGRFAIRAAASLYEAILDKLELQGRNVFAGRASTSLKEKILILLSLWKTSKGKK